MDNDTNNTDESSVDLSGISLDTSSSVDLSGLDTMIGNITIAGGGSSSGLLMGGYQAGYGAIPTITLGGNGGTGYTWTSSSPSIYTTTGTTGVNVSNAIKVKGDADIDGDLRVGGRSVLESLERIEKRLAILVPDPARLNKFEALKQAWEHYKTLEALCVEQDDDTDKG